LKKYNYKPDYNHLSNDINFENIYKNERNFPEEFLNWYKSFDFIINFIVLY